MKQPKVYIEPNKVTPNQPILFDESLCNGCNKCIYVCRSDVMMPNPEEKKVPLVVYPDECWYCGCCVIACPSFPEEPAIKVNEALTLKGVIGWKRKDTGEYYRIGMKNPPPPNNRPPAGGWKAKA